MDKELEKIKERKLRELEQRLTEKPAEKPKPPTAPVVLTDASFDEFVQRHPVAVVDFWAEWCMPCRLVAPIIEELARKYAGKVAFGKLNVGENPGKPAEFGVMAIPTLVFFKNGKPADQVVGAVPRSELERRLEVLLR